MDTLAGPVRFEETIKRSRFIAHLAPITSEAETLDFYDSVAAKDATHNCWAWRVDLRVRFNDDGEPSGTAGRPMLSVLEGRDIDRVMAVVTRYYGGIKLGVGGLVRAYSGVVAKCLDQAERVPIIRWVRCEVSAGFSHANAIHHLCEQMGLRKITESFNEDGLVLAVETPQHSMSELERALKELSRGDARLRTLRG